VRPRHRRRHHRRHCRRGQPGGADRRQGLPGVPAALPPPRLGRALPGGDLAGDDRGDPRGPDQGRRVRARRGRDHQPAGDRGAVGPRDAGLAAARDRVAGPADGRHLRPAAGRGARGPRGRAHRPAPGPLLLGHQADVARRARAAHLGAGAVGSVRRGHRRLLPGRPDDTRHLARHRRLQRVPDAAARPRGRRLVRGALLALRRPPRRPAGPRPQLGGGRADGPGGLPRPLPADRRHRGRPAVSALRADLLRGRRVQVHLRHRLLHPHQHRVLAGAQRRGPAVHRGVAVPRRRPHLRAGGGHLRHRCRRAVAARRTAGGRVRGRDRRHRLDGRGHRRRRVRAGPHRAGRPPLGSSRPRHDPRHHPRHDPRPPRPGDPRGDRLRGPRRAGDAPRALRPAGRRRSGGQRPAVPAAGRPGGAAGGAPRDRGDHRAGCGVPRGPRHRRLGLDRRPPRDVGARPSLRARGRPRGAGRGVPALDPGRRARQGLGDGL
ncbi:MAG: Glycerol kinase, partial [uncultured Nocardioides sp.]